MKRIDIKKNLTKFSREAITGKYKSKKDETWYAWLRAVLILLERKNPDLDEQQSRYSSIVGKDCYFKCTKCEGDGYINVWEGGDEKHMEDKVIRDCDLCDGQGFLKLNVLDKRNKSKNKELFYLNEY